MDNTCAGKISCWELISPSRFLPMSLFETQQHNLLKMKGGICSAIRSLRSMICMWPMDSKTPFLVKANVAMSSKSDTFCLVCAWEHSVLTWSRCCTCSWGPGSLLQSGLPCLKAFVTGRMMSPVPDLCYHLTLQKPKHMWADGWQSGKSTCSTTWIIETLHQ